MYIFGKHEDGRILFMVNTKLFSPVLGGEFLSLSNVAYYYFSFWQKKKINLENDYAFIDVHMILRMWWFLLGYLIMQT